VSSVIAPLRSRPFRNLVIGSTVSRLGNSIAPVALAFAVLDLTGSATSLGIVVGARSLANVIFALLGGVVADRLPRNIVLVGSSLAGAVTQGLVAVLVFERIDSVALLAALSAVNGTVSAFALPASVALIPQTVPAEQLVPANAFARMVPTRPVCWACLLPESS
jgi:MFS family permease